jgi:hypothetical protein
MPILHDFKCPNGHVFERMVEWNTERIPCPECYAKISAGGGRVYMDPTEYAEIVFLPHSERSENANHFEPVLVFKKRDGTFIFPGRSNERTPKGCERVELKNIAQVRRFEREENQRLKNIHQESMGRRGANYEAEKKERREQLKAILGKMSPRVRKLAEFAMKQSDEKESYSSRASRYDANFRIDAFSNDRSNRSEFRDSDTDWKKRE